MYNPFLIYSTDTHTMSTTWIRGSRCGIDNCRSRHYRTIDGRRICQYGHVNESHIEYNDDEEDFDNATGGGFHKRIRLGPSPSQQGAQHKKRANANKRDTSLVVFGIQERELFLRVFQFLYKRQIDAVIDVWSLPRETFQHTAKQLWCRYLQSGFTAQRGTMEDWLQDQLARPSSSHSSGKTKTKHYESRLFPELVDLLALLMLALRSLRIPIYSCDLIRLVETQQELPFIRAWDSLPRALQVRCSGKLMGMLRDESMPQEGALYEAIERLAHNMSLEGLQLNYHPLILKLVHKLCLPLQTYTVATNIVKARGIVFQYNRDNSEQLGSYSQLNLSPELLVIALVVSAVRFLFLTGKINAVKWKEAYLALRKNNERTNISIDSILQELHHTGEPELYDWDDSKIGKYLDWVEHSNVVVSGAASGTASSPGPSQTTSLGIAKKRLYDIFPLNLIREEGKNEAEDSAAENNPQEKSILKPKPGPKPTRLAKPNLKLKLSQIQTLTDCQTYISQETPTQAQEPLTIRSFHHIEDFLISQLHNSWGLSFKQLQHIQINFEPMIYEGVEINDKDAFDPMNNKKRKKKYRDTSRYLRSVFNHEEVSTSEEIKEVLQEKLPERKSRPRGRTKAK